MWSAMTIKAGTPTAKLILLKLADNANDKGECWPSLKNISEHCEVSQKTVIENIKKLEKLGLVKKVNRFNEKGKTSNLYILTLSGENDRPCEESSTTHVKKGNKGGEESSTTPCEESSTTPYEKTSHESVIKEPVINESIRESLSLTGVITVSQLEAFIEHRKAIKRKMTPRAIEMFVKRLNDLAEQGHNVPELIETAIISGWQNVYPDKNAGPKGQGGFQTRKEQISERNMQACQDFIGGSDHE